jgi:hypothetical protein
MFQLSNYQDLPPHLQIHLTRGNSVLLWLGLIILEVTIVIPLYCAQCLKWLGINPLLDTGLFGNVLSVMVGVFAIACCLIYSHEPLLTPTGELSDVVNKLVELYTEQRTQHIDTSHLTLWNMLRKAQGKKDIFLSLMYKDQTNKDTLGKIILEIFNHNDVKNHDIKTIVSRIKHHKSIITDRANFLVIFAVALTTLLLLKDTHLFSSTITKCILFIFTGFGMLGVFERQSIVRQCAIYDEVITALDEYVLKHQ